MKYAIHQFNLTDEQAARINKHGWEAAPEHYSDVRSGRATPEQYRETFAAGHFVHVCDIEAFGLGHVFEIGNVGPESCITRIAERMSSLSVGNLVHAVDSDVWYTIDPFDFTNIGQIGA